MILSAPLPIVLFTLLFSLCANANADDTEETGADFLEFLAEIEETTGDGFEVWLEDESSDQLDDSSNQYTGSNK